MATGEGFKGFPAMPKLRVQERPDIGFQFGQFMAQLTGVMRKIHDTPDELVIQLSFYMERLFDRIEELTPIDMSNSADDIVASESWHKETFQEGESSVVWQFWNTASNPKNGFAYPGMGYGEPGSTHTLEYGWSHDQAPNGMVRVALEEFRAELTRLKLRS